MKKIILTFAIFILIINLLEAQVSTNGLLLYLPLNGNANDYSGNSNNGTVSGATLTTDRFGTTNSAYYFNGTSYYISISNATNFTNNNYTVSLWAMPTSTQPNSQNGGMIYNIGGANGVGQALTYTTDARYYAGSYNISSPTTQSVNQSDTIYHPNKWSFITITRDNSLIKLYVNGKYVGYQSYSEINEYDANYGTTPYGFKLGARTNLSSVKFYDGKIDEVRYYNRTLTADEVKTLFNDSKTKVVNDTATYNVCSTSFQSVSPKIYYETSDTVINTDSTIVTITNYYSKYVYSSDCCSESTTSATTEKTASVENENTSKSEDINVFPNPTTGKLYVNFGDDTDITNYKIQIINSSSETIYTNNVENKNSTLDLKNFSKGLYLLKISFNNQIVKTQKIILQ